MIILMPVRGPATQRHGSQQRRQGATGPARERFAVGANGVFAQEERAIINGTELPAAMPGTDHHSVPEDGAVPALVSGNQRCVSGVLLRFGAGLDASLLHRDQQLLQLRVAGTADDGFDRCRSYMVLDWLIRAYAPTWLDRAALPAAATRLRNLHRVAGRGTAQSAAPAVRAAADEARAVSAAAWATHVACEHARIPRAAAAAAAVAAADPGAAAWSVVEQIGTDAGAAAWAAARDARAVCLADAWGSGAGRAALQPMIEDLQVSAYALFAAMIDPPARGGRAGGSGQRQRDVGQADDPAVDDPHLHPLTEAEEAQPAALECVGGERQLGAVVEQHGATARLRYERRHSSLHVEEPP